MDCSCKNKKNVYWDYYCEILCNGYWFNNFIICKFVLYKII